MSRLRAIVMVWQLIAVASGAPLVVVMLLPQRLTPVVLNWFTQVSQAGVVSLLTWHQRAFPDVSLLLLTETKPESK